MILNFQCPHCSFTYGASVEPGCNSADCPKCGALVGVIGDGLPATSERADALRGLTFDAARDDGKVKTYAKLGRRMRVGDYLDLLIAAGAPPANTLSATVHIVLHSDKTQERIEIEASWADLDEPTYKRNAH